jgi:uncharacterized protein (TIGR02147 family)
VSEVAPRARGVLDVFRYLDYRAFLADLYRAQKRRGLSYRAFSRRAGLGAPNYLKLVIEGERNLTAAMARRFAEAAGLAGDAERYFCELVAFCQARSAADKATHHRRLLAFQRYRNAHRLDASHAEYHSAWYVPAIRELVTSRDFAEDPAWIARRLTPPIKASEAKRALAVLLKLGLVVRDETGRLRQSAVVLSTGPETSGLHIASYHTEMMKRAAAAIDLVPASERDISALTLCVGERGLARLKQRIQALRRELLELAEDERERCQVVQLNLQLFPLSNTGGSAQRKRASRQDFQVRAGAHEQAAEARGSAREQSEDRDER